MSSLVDDVVDMATLARGRAALDVAPIDLRAVADEALALTAAGREERRQSLAFTPPADPLPMRGEAGVLVRTLARLLVRASGATPREGRVGLALQRADDGAHAVLAVRDGGPAIDPAALDPQVAWAAPADPVHGTSGLAFDLVRQAVALHEGTLAVRSDAEGTALVLTLPLAPVPGIRRILVVDDEHDTADVLSLVLARDGHAVRAVYRGGDVVPAAHAFRPDVVLLDIGLPDRDGLEVARALRDDARLAGIRIFAVSGYARDEDVQRSRAAGVDEHLTKPVDIERLRDLLRTLP
jgi:CheY-like chemotaxis protein